MLSDERSLQVLAYIMSAAVVLLYSLLLRLYRIKLAERLSVEDNKALWEENTLGPALAWWGGGALIVLASIRLRQSWNGPAFWIVTELFVALWLAGVIWWEITRLRAAQCSDAAIRGYLIYQSARSVPVLVLLWLGLYFIRV